MNMGEDNNVLVAILGGIPKGIVFVPVRALLDVYDLITFPLPWPKSYGYWIEPETLIEGFDKLNYEEKAATS